MPAWPRQYKALASRCAVSRSDLCQAKGTKFPPCIDINFHGHLLRPLARLSNALGLRNLCPTWVKFRRYLRPSPMSDLLPIPAIGLTAVHRQNRTCNAVHSLSTRRAAISGFFRNPLLEKGASTAAVNEFGETPIDVAKSHSVCISPPNSNKGM